MGGHTFGDNTSRIIFRTILRPENTGQLMGLFVLLLRLICQNIYFKFQILGEEIVKKSDLEIFQVIVCLFLSYRKFQQTVSFVTLTSAGTCKIKSTYVKIYV